MISRPHLPICLLFGCLMAACRTTPETTGTTLSLEAAGDSITLNWGGKARLGGGLPVLQKTGFLPGPAHTQGTADSATLTFAGGVAVSAKFRQEAGVVLFHLSPAGRHSGKGDDFIGLLFRHFPGFRRGVAFHRYGPVKAWTHPVAVPDPGRLALADDVQFFLWQYTDSTYGAAMPLGGNGYNATLGTESGAFGARAVSLADGQKPAAVPVLAVAFGKDPYRAIEELYAAGMEAMGRSGNLRQKKQFPAVFESIGWCTWNAYGHALSEEKILSGVRTFTDRKFPLPFLLIDDGWLHITGPNGRLKTFTPDPVKFPGGLKPVVRRLKTDHGVRHVGVWHTLNGYWGGVDTAADLGKKYRDILMPYRDKVTWTDTPVETFYGPTVTSAAGGTFFDHWYAYLKGEGISFVKVDNQLVIDRMARRNRPLWDAGAQAEANLQGAVARHFGGAVVNCMDMTTNVLYHLGPSAVARASEDFFPDNTTYHLQHGNAAVHVLCAVSNSLWLSPMVWPDYDMFQSHHPDAEFHAVARAISGGPVYFTDTPGKQKFDVIRPLVYRDGRIIRADVPARPTEDCLFDVQAARPFKAFSRSGGAGLLGVWNVADADRVTGTFRPADVHGLAGGRFAVYEHFSKRLQVAGRTEALPLDLKRMGYALYHVVPLNDARAAAIGLVNKYNAPKTLLRHSVSGNVLEAALPEGGTFGAYLAKAPVRVEVDGTPVTGYRYAGNLLEVPLPDDATKQERLVRVVL